MFRQTSKVWAFALVWLTAAVLAVAAMSSGAGDAEALSCESAPATQFGDGLYGTGCGIADGVYVAEEFTGICNVVLTDVNGEPRYSAFVGRAVVYVKGGWDGSPGAILTIESDGCGTWERRPWMPLGETTANDSFGPGAYEVGREIKPGIYESSSVSERCFWFYLDNWLYEDATSSAVIVWQFGSPVVEIPEDAFGFYSARCGTWTLRDDAGSGDVATKFGDGSYLPGIDIAAGLYASLGGDGLCEWYRTSPVSFLVGDSAGDSAGGLRSSGRQVAEVKVGDVGFSARGCGEWRLVEGPEGGEEDTAVASFGTGTYIIGREFAPGTYVSEVDNDGGRCSWDVLSGFGGSAGDVTRSGVGLLRGIVRLLPSDLGFRSSGCSGWTSLVDLEATQLLTSFGDGEYVVGVHIAPGLYIGDGAGVGRCFWRRFGDFTGADSDVLGVRNPVGRVIVRISEEDEGFESLGCGTWRHVESDARQPSPSLSASFGSGTWRVGVEVRPGLYMAALRDDRYCFWGRYSDFTGAPEDLLAGSFAVGHALVLVGADDVGVYSDNCGVWELTSSLPHHSPVAEFGDGVYLVGAEVLPGTYETRNAAGGPCVWSRLSGFKGTDFERKATVVSEGAAFVTLLASDVGFRSAGCETWRRLMIPEASVDAAPFGDGTYVVGRDVAPGIYEAHLTDSSRCRWVRLSDWSWTFGVITERRHEGRAIVEISSSDAGFHSSGCGEWLPVSSESVDGDEPSTQFADGVYRVGGDVAAGVYRSDQQFEVGECRWRRVSDFGGTRSGVIARGGSESGDWIVEIKSEDVGFESSGCGEWSPIGASDIVTAEQSLTEFGDGVYRVGMDIEPGAYVSYIGTVEYVDGEYVPPCRWSRVSGFGHEDADALERGMGRGEQRMVVAEGDTGVVSVGCGTWVRE